MATILTICPYKLLPLRGGGALRCFHLLRQLARCHEVHAIIFQREEQLRRETDGYRLPSNIRVYSPLDYPPPQSFFDKLPRSLGPGLHFRFLRRSWRGPAESTLLHCYHLLQEILTKYRIDLALFEHISSMYAAPLVKRLGPKALRLLDAHNVDHVLMKQEMTFSSGKASTVKHLRRSYRNVSWIEQHLGKFIDCFWACSDDDRRTLESFNGLKGFTIPNGIDTVALGFDDTTKKAFRKGIIFCGSLEYPPNMDGIRWFSERIWPILKTAQENIHLTVIGRGGGPKKCPELAGNSNVNFVGEVDDVRPHYRNAGVAVVPLRMGSGTRLKILEAMSLGNPVVSTRIGVEGIQAIDGEHILLADEPKHFADAVLRLFSDRKLFESIRRAARRLVETGYEWQVIERLMNQAIQELLENRLSKIDNGLHSFRK